MTNPLSLSLQAWTPAHAALHQAVRTNDVRAAHAALAQGADVQAEAEVGPFKEPMTALAHVLSGTLPDPQWAGLRQVNLPLLQVVLSAAPARWEDGPDAKEAMRSMTGHAVTNRSAVWEMLMKHGLAPTALHLLDAVFPVTGAFKEAPRVVKGLHARLSPLPLWDHLWPHLAPQERQKALHLNPFEVLFRGRMGETEMNQAKWWLQHGASLDTSFDRLVQLAPSLEDRPAHQEALTALVRHEATLVDQRMSQLVLLLEGRANERTAGLPLTPHLVNTVNTLMNQLGRGWDAYHPEVQDRLRATAPLQWFTQGALVEAEQHWGCWLIEHGASLFTRYEHPQTEQRTHALEAMEDDDVRERWACHEADHGQTLLPRAEWEGPGHEWQKALQRLAEDPTPSPPSRRRRRFP